MSSTQDTLLGLARPVAAMLILAVGMGYIEAAIVVYLREVLAPVRERHFPGAARQPLPLLTPQRLRDAGAEKVRILAIEFIREPAPLAVMAACAWALSRRKVVAVGLFAIGFGLWDIAYYVFLRVLTGWPDSLGSWDVLYLIPVPWVAPVWAPLLVAVTTFAAGIVAVVRAGMDRPIGRSRAAWAAVACGTALVLASFFTRTREAFGAIPSRFDWPWLLSGWLLGVAGLCRLLWPGPRGSRPVPMPP